MDTLFSTASLPILGRLLAEPLVVVDVGARWGVSSIWNELGDRCVHVGFEPDTAECERLMELFRDRRNMRFVPCALGDEVGLSTLYLTKNRAGSSILHPSEDAKRRHPGLEGAEVEATTIIETTTLDQWCLEAGVERVDAVKVDTQGSELAVLKGAAGALGSARAIEVEVEFNELYDDVPLFADVDRFLRSQGFVLWKLRDLAHYAQAGVPTGWRNVESCHYDTGAPAASTGPPWHMAMFAGGPGQLFWANAIYLKVDVARPDPDLGWERLVRDACITRAYNLVDLATVALNQAKQTAPEEVLEAIELALDSDRARFRHDLQTMGSPTLSQTLRLSVDDPAWTGEGWHPLQLHDLGPVRWTGPGRDAWVDVPVVLVPGTRVEMLSVSAMTSAIRDGLELEVNRVPIPVSRSPHEHGTLYHGVVPHDYHPTRRFTRVMLRIPATVAWRDDHPESDDDSELGLALSWLRFTPPE